MCSSYFNDNVAFVVALHKFTVVKTVTSVQNFSLLASVASLPDDSAAELNTGADSRDCSCQASTATTATFTAATATGVVRLSDRQLFFQPADHLLSDVLLPCKRFGSDAAAPM